MKRGEIYLVDFKNTQGSIQSGLRPALVIQNNKANKFSSTTIVCCITSVAKKPLPTHVYLGKDGGLIRNSTALCEQVFTINQSDCKVYLGSITNQSTLNRLDKSIQDSLGIKRNSNKC